MFKRLFPVIIAVTITACSSEPATPAGPTLTEKWTVTDGIETPESAYMDPKSGDIYVSLIAGSADQKDGNGRIAKISADGKTVNSSWVAGMNAPKGLRSHDGTLWTADIDEIIGIDMATAKIKSRVKVTDAKFLNDVATGSDGAVYVSDLMASKIYALIDGKVSVFAEGEDLEYPNGLLVEGDSLIVGGWGKPVDGFTTKVPGRLFKLDLKTKMKTLITPEPMANIDGLESDGKGGYIVTDWIGGKVLRISGDGKIELVKQLTQGTADIGYVPAQNLLLIPHMPENKIVAYDVTGLN